MSIKFIYTKGILLFIMPSVLANYMQMQSEWREPFATFINFPENVQNITRSGSVLHIRKKGYSKMDGTRRVCI